MGQWVFPTTRWALYLRDNLRCLYCGVTAQEVVEAQDDNFLTLDHLKPKSKAKDQWDNSPWNLTTCCYSCNVTKGTMTVAKFCSAMGWSLSAVRSRIAKRRKRDVEHFRSAAKLLLGLFPGIPGLQVSTLVEDHDWIVKRRWGESVEGDYWAHLRQQDHLFCPTCNAPKGSGSSEESSALRPSGRGATVIPFSPAPSGSSQPAWSDMDPDQIDWASVVAPF